MRQVTVTTPSRLHFGLYAFSDSGYPFGGVGCMVDEPALTLTVTPGDRFEIWGPLHNRVIAFVRKTVDAFDWKTYPHCTIRVLDAPPEHTGLGLGTQLGLAVATALDGFVYGAARPASELADAVGRGRRSAIGTHGFERGGWIFDGGHQGSESIGVLEKRLPLPDEWRVVLIAPADRLGLSGRREENAFASAPAIRSGTTRVLRGLVLEKMAPAIERNDFDQFADALHRYGRHAGECFAHVQGGAFAGPHIEQLIDTLLDLDVTGCGQSSWGPTVFAFVPNESAAATLRDTLRQDRRYQETQITITRPSNTGARVTIVEQSAEEPRI